ncbi:hypothetical protein E2320_010890, partial [Naja naja]
GLKPPPTPRRGRKEGAGRTSPGCWRGGPTAVPSLTGRPVTGAPGVTSRPCALCGCIGETRAIDRRKERAESTRGKGTAEGSLRETGRRGCRRRRERPGLELWRCSWRGLPGSCGFWGYVHIETRNT